MIFTTTPLTGALTPCPDASEALFIDSVSCTFWTLFAGVISIFSPSAT